MPPGRSHRRAFTLVEFLVLLGIVVILLSIFIPYISRTREMSNRNRCLANLANLSTLLREYAKREGDARGAALLPSTVYDAQNHPNSYTAFTGPDDPDPFAPNTKVQPNDVTASLFLLMRGGYLANGEDAGLAAFICPSSGDYPDRLTDSAGHRVKADQRSNFRSPRNLSYGYCSPFSSAQKFRLNTDWLSSDFAVMADKGPGKDALLPSNAPALEMRKGNSNNHGEAGQNVLYGDGHVSFQRTPYCGYREKDGRIDNIYTAAATTPTTQPITGSEQGFFGRKYAPVNWGDSYLVPSENDD